MATRVTTGKMRWEGEAELGDISVHKSGKGTLEKLILGGHTGVLNSLGEEKRVRRPGPRKCGLRNLRVTVTAFGRGFRPLP